MSDQTDPGLGTKASMEGRQSHLTDTPHGGGWRMFAEPVEVEAFVNEIWLPVLVDGFDEESAEIWVRWPPVETHPSKTSITRSSTPRTIARRKGDSRQLSHLRGRHSGRHI